MRLPDPPARAVGLLERSTEIEAARRALTEAVEGDGCLVVIEGPAGIGKTRLLEATRGLADERGVRVLTARGGRLERDFAYGVVRQLLERVVVEATPAERDAWLGGPAVHAGRALGLADDAAGGGRDTEDKAFAVRHGLYWLLSNLSLAGPVLVAVDDVQWADAPSLRFLAYLTRRLEGVALMVAVTARSGEEGPEDRVLAEVTDDAAARRITPAPLSLRATESLLELDGVPVAASFALACHAATDGNPFLLHERRSALRVDGVAPTAANAHRVAGLGPTTVARSLILRIGSISPVAVAVAAAVAVLGTSAEPEHAAALAGTDVPTALAADLATRYLRRALAEPPGATDLVPVLGELGRATWLAGEDPVGAVAHLRSALAGTSRAPARPAAAIALARAILSTGDVTAAAAVLEEELARPTEVARQDLLNLEAELGSIRLLHQATPEHGRRILSFADLPGDTVAEMLALTNVAAWWWLAGTAEQVSSVARRSLGQGRAVAAAGSDSIAVLQAAWTAC